MEGWESNSKQYTQTRWGVCRGEDGVGVLGYGVVVGGGGGEGAVPGLGPGRAV